MAIIKNWDLHGQDGHWSASVKPTELGSKKIELTLSHNAPAAGPVTRDFRGDNDRSIKARRMVTELDSVAEITELADLLHTLADAVKAEQG